MSDPQSYSFRIEYSNASGSEDNDTDLGKVVRESMSSLNQIDSLEESDLEAVRKVIESEKSDSVDQTCTVRIIDALLANRCSPEHRGTSEWNAMVMEVARVLYQTPETRNRIARLWDRIRLAS